MDLGRIYEQLDRRSYEQNYAELYDRRSRDEERSRLVQERGRELAKRYAAVADGFQAIFDRTGWSDSMRPNCITTPDINLELRADPVLGQGRIVAYLEAHDHELHGTLDTAACFMFITDDGGRISLGSERLWTVGMTFGGGLRWIKEPYFPWNERLIKEGYEEMSPRIVSAQETQALINLALDDPVLNPQFATAEV